MAELNYGLKKIKIKLLENIEFQINESFSLKRGTEIGFCVENILYATHFTKKIKSKLFGEIDLSKLTDSEKILFCVAQTIAHEQFKNLRRVKWL